MSMVGLDDSRSLLNGAAADREPDAREGVAGIDDGAEDEERKGLRIIDTRRRTKGNIAREMQSYLYDSVGIHRANV
jgi:hypothetical protein